MATETNNIQNENFYFHNIYKFYKEMNWMFPDDIQQHFFIPRNKLFLLNAIKYLKWTKYAKLYMNNTFNKQETQQHSLQKKWSSNDNFSQYTHMH